jgi:hypothetical protein
VSAFQARQGVPVTGTIDAPTWAGLLPFSLLAVILPGNPTPIGPPIARVQEALNRAGTRPLLAITGSLDPPTSTALAGFQSTQFLPVTGGLDPATWRALARAEAAEAPTQLLRLEFAFDPATFGTGLPVATWASGQILEQQPRPSRRVDPAAPGTGFWIELWDVTGVVLFREVIPDPFGFRTGGYPSVPVALRPGTFSVVVPHLARAETFALFGPPLQHDHLDDPSSLLLTFDLTGP